MRKGEVRFAFVAEVDISIDNGPGINEREFIRSLLENYPGQVTCFVPSLSRALPWTDPGLITVRGGARGVFPYLQFVTCAVSALLRAHRERPFSAFVFRPGGTPILPVAIAQLTGAPIALKKLGLYSIFGPGSQRSKLKNAVSRGFKMLYRKMISTAAAADCESALYLEWLESTFGTLPSIIDVIPNGVNIDQFVLGDKSERRDELGLGRFERLIGYVGALSPLRNLDLLIRSFAECRTLNSLGLLLIGDGPLRKDLEQLAASLGVADRVVFMGAVSYSDVPSIIQALDIAVDLTAVEMHVDGRTRITSYSQKIPQYLACGTPVVAWHCDDTAFVERAKLGATPAFLDIDDCCLALHRLLETPEQELQQMRERARHYAIENFSYAELVHRRMKLWGRMLSISNEREGLVALQL